MKCKQPICCSCHIRCISYSWAACSIILPQAVSLWQATNATIYIFSIISIKRYRNNRIHVTFFKKVFIVCSPIHTYYGIRKGSSHARWRIGCRCRPDLSVTEVLGQLRSKPQYLNSGDSVSHQALIGIVTGSCCNRRWFRFYENPQVPRRPETAEPSRRIRRCCTHDWNPVRYVDDSIYGTCVPARCSSSRSSSRRIFAADAQGNEYIVDYII